MHKSTWVLHDAHLYMDATWCTNIIHWLLGTWQERLAGTPVYCFIIIIIIIIVIVIIVSLLQGYRQGLI